MRKLMTWPIFYVSNIGKGGGVFSKGGNMHMRTLNNTECLLGGGGGFNTLLALSRLFITTYLRHKYVQLTTKLFTPLIAFVYRLSSSI